VAIAKGYINNFQTLARAFEDNNCCLVECTDRETGKPVITVCAVQERDGVYEMVPFAKMFDGNPYEELDPPLEGEL